MWLTFRYKKRNKVRLAAISMLVGLACLAAAQPVVVSAQEASDRVAFDQNLVIEAGEVVRGNVSVTNGDLTVYGRVMGNAVVFSGDAEIVGEVRGDVAVTGGDVRLGPQSQVGGNVVVVSGVINSESGARVGGITKTVPVPFGKLGEGVIPPVLKMGPEEPWATGDPVGQMTRWMVLGMGSLVALGLAAILALVVPERVRVTRATLEAEPGPSIVVGIIAAAAVLPLAGALAFLLLVTVIGMVLLPVLAAVVLLSFLFGLVVVSTWLGQRVYETSHQGNGYISPPLLVQVLLGMAVLLSSTLVPAAFLPPWIIFPLGLLLYLAASVGLGAAILSRFGALAPPKRGPRAAEATVPSATTPLGGRTE